MYYFESYVSQLDSDFNLCKVLYNNSIKDKNSINDIQNQIVIRVYAQLRRVKIVLGHFIPKVNLRGLKAAFKQQ